MFLASIQHPNGRYLVPDDTGRWSASAPAPAWDTEYLVENRSRRDALAPAPCEHLGVRFLRTHRFLRFALPSEQLRIIYSAPVGVASEEGVVPPPIEEIRDYWRSRWEIGILDRAPVAAPVMVDLAELPSTGSASPFPLVAAARSCFPPSRGLQVRLAVDLQLVLRVFASREVGLAPVIIGAPGVFTAEPGEELFLDGWTCIKRFFLRPDSGDGVVATPLPLSEEEGWFTLLPHSVKARLRTPDGKFLRLGLFGRTVVDDDPTLRGTLGDELTIVNYRQIEGQFEPFELAPFSDTLFHGDVVSLRMRNGMQLTARNTAEPEPALEPIAPDGASPAYLRVIRVDGEGEVRDGDRVVLEEASGDPRPRRLVADERHRVRLSATRAGTELAVELGKDLDQFFAPASGDHALLGGDPALRPGLARPSARARRSPVARSRPLRSYFRIASGRIDTLTTASELGMDVAAREGYTFGAIEGFVLSHPAAGTSPLRVYRGPAGSGGEYFTTALREDEEAAAAAGYAFAWQDAYAFAPQGEPAVRADPGMPRIDRGRLPYELLRAFVTLPQDVASVVRWRIGPLLFPRGARPRVPRVRALVLSGGGAKGCFEAGAVKYLWERCGYRPDIICGVSVGAINALKLSENRDESARELVELWRELSAGPGVVFERDHHLRVFAGVLDRVIDRLRDSAKQAGLGALLGAFLLPGGGLVSLGHGAVGGLLGFLFGSALNNLDARGLAAINGLLNLFHGIHSMAPLRTMLRRYVAENAGRLSAGGVDLRVGITDLQSGQFFTVSGLQPGWAGSALAHAGAVATEPEHALGATWLHRPLYGADRYAIPLADAVYASCVQPFYMEPMAVDLGATTVIPAGDERVALLSTGVPREVDELVAVSNGGGRAAGPGVRSACLDDPSPVPDPLDAVDWEGVERVLERLVSELPVGDQQTRTRFSRYAEDGDLAFGANRRLFYDGGLRDTIPLATALRLGATEVVVITGDRVQQTFNPRSFPTRFDPGLTSGVLGGFFSLLGASPWQSVAPMQAPLIQHVLGMMNLWLNEVTRADVLVPWAENEMKGWFARALARVPPGDAESLREEFGRYWRGRSAVAFDELGTTTPMGGPVPANGARITYIAPGREIVGALDFDNANAVEEGLQLGYEAARVARVLSDHAP